MNRKQTGNQGEQQAKKLLKNKGYTFLHQNYRTHYGEIDLIFRHRGVYIFVEVKTRNNTTQGLPEEAVTPRKISKITRVAQHYLLEHDHSNAIARIDVVAIDKSQKPPQIMHLENVSQ